MNRFKIGIRNRDKIIWFIFPIVTIIIAVVAIIVAKSAIEDA